MHALTVSMQAETNSRNQLIAWCGCVEAKNPRVFNVYMISFGRRILRAPSSQSDQEEGLSIYHSLNPGKAIVIPKFIVV